MNGGFEPTMAAALQRLEAVRPAAYARTRNHLDGAVTGLSPYLTHGLLTLPQVIAHLADRHGVDGGHKLVFELGWRAWFRHLWRHAGDGILASLHPGPLPDEAYARVFPQDVLEARTGVAAIDQAVRALAREGYLHNHARMWLASYLVHVRKLHWRVGADWMLGHLLDGDLASNHLSWQWVAGTGSRKPYLFNAENVARWAPASWHSPGAVIDTDYATLERVARTPLAAAGAEAGLPAAGAPAVLPPLLQRPPGDGFAEARAEDVAGRDVWLVHPWSLGEPPADLARGALRLAVCDAGFHARWPWTARRWQFVAARMRAIADHAWFDDGAAIAQALAAARSVDGLRDPHLGPALSALTRREPAPAFEEPAARCASFSAWWARSRPIGIARQARP